MNTTVVVSRCSDSCFLTGSTCLNSLGPSDRWGPRFNIKISSYQYRKSHWGDKTVVRSSYHHNGISYTGKISALYWIRALQVDIGSGIFLLHDGSKPLPEPSSLPFSEPLLAYSQTSNISHTLGDKFVDHSDVVGAWPVGAAPTTSSL